MIKVSITSFWGRVCYSTPKLTANVLAAFADLELEARSLHEAPLLGVLLAF